LSFISERSSFFSGFFVSAAVGSLALPFFFFCSFISGVFDAATFSSLGFKSLDF